MSNFSYIFIFFITMMTVESCIFEIHMHTYYTSIRIPPMAPEVEPVILRLSVPILVTIIQNF